MRKEELIKLADKIGVDVRNYEGKPPTRDEIYEWVKPYYKG